MFVEKADPQMKGSEQAAWLNRLAREHDNLRAALDWYQTAKEGAESGLRLAGALGRFWEVHTHWSEGRVQLASALAREEAQSRTNWRAHALNSAGYLACRQGDNAAARELHGESMGTCRE